MAKLKFDHNGEPNRHALHDVGQAAANLALQAHALGLAVHQMAGILPDKAREIFGIPEGYEPVAGIAIGYPGEPENLAGSTARNVKWRRANANRWIRSSSPESGERFRRLSAANPNANRHAGRTVHARLEPKSKSSRAQRGSCFSLNRKKKQIRGASRPRGMRFGGLRAKSSAGRFPAGIGICLSCLCRRFRTARRIRRRSPGRGLRCA